MGNQNYIRNSFIKICSVVRYYHSFFKLHCIRQYVPPIHFLYIRNTDMQVDSCLQLQCMRVANSSESMQVCTGGKKLFSGKVMFNIDIGEKTKHIHTMLP